MPSRRQAGDPHATCPPVRGRRPRAGSPRPAGGSIVTRVGTSTVALTNCGRGSTTTLCRAAQWSGGIVPEPVEQRRPDRWPAAEHQEEHGFPPKALGVVVGDDGPAAPGHHQCRPGPQRQIGGRGPSRRHGPRRGLVERPAALGELVVEPAGPEQPARVAGDAEGQRPVGPQPGSVAGRPALIGLDGRDSPGGQEVAVEVNDDGRGWPGRPPAAAPRSTARRLRRHRRGPRPRPRTRGGHRCG